MPVVLLFIDGVGIGRRDPAHNPLARNGWLLSRFGEDPGAPVPYGGQLRALDTCFEVPGRPQSASNQTAMLTGDPAPAVIGRHVLGYPDAALADLLRRRSIVKRLRAAGRTATFANAYPAAYLDALGLARTSGPPFDATALPASWRRRLKPSATTLAMAAGEVPLRTLEDAWAGEAVTNDLDGHRARQRGLAAPERSPEEAGRILLGLVARTDFVLFEHYLADEAGHARDHAAAAAALDGFDRFARYVIENKPADTHVLVCSDHGNVEDLSTRSHTTNPVALLHFGPRADALDGARSVADAGGAVLRLLGVEG